MEYFDEDNGISLMTVCLAWFMLQMVIAGNGISVMTVATGSSVIISGDVDHVSQMSDMK